MKLTEAQNELDYMEAHAEGWNRGVLDFQDNIADAEKRCRWKGEARERYLEGYREGQDNCLIERAKLREAGVVIVG